MGEKSRENTNVVLGTGTQSHPGVEEEANIREMEGGVDPPSGHQQRGLELDILPL